jgi:hypothetical protein
LRTLRILILDPTGQCIDTIRSRIEQTIKSHSYREPMAIRSGEVPADFLARLAVCHHSATTSEVGQREEALQP